MSNPLFPKVELPPEPKGWPWVFPQAFAEDWADPAMDVYDTLDPDPLHFEEATPADVAAARKSPWYLGYLYGRESARRSSSKAWLLLALGVGAALGFVAGWVAR